MLSSSSRLQFSNSSCRRVSTKKPCVSVRASNGQISLKLNIPYRCNYGQSLAVVGSIKPLGVWKPQQAVKMVWNEGDIWSTKIKFEESPKEVEYKYLVLERNGTVNVWKPGRNYNLEIPNHTSGFLNVADSWDDCFKIIDFEEAQLESAEEPGGAEEEGGYRMLEEGVEESYRQLIMELSRSVELRRHAKDPAAPDLLTTDRRIAAANNKLVAFNRAMKASLAFPSIPPPRSFAVLASGDAETPPSSLVAPPATIASRGKGQLRRGLIAP